MPRIVRTLVVLLVALTAFAAGAYTSASRAWLQPVVILHIENASTEPLTSMLVEHGGYGVKGRIEVAPPAQGNKIAVPFFHQGEGGCRVTVTRADGGVFDAACGYIEPGYMQSFKITATGIVGGLAKP
jgi:hypothetical protein